MNGPARRALCALCAVGLLALASCGARWSDDQKAAIEARDASLDVLLGSAMGRPLSPTDQAPQSVEADVGGAQTGHDDGTADVGGPEVAAPSEAAGAESADLAAGPAPCTAPSDAPGVDDGTINVGSISSLSGPVPGLGSSSAAAIRAYVGHLNASGGVCGRQIRLREADDGTDNGRYRSLVNEMSGQVFAVVGGFAMGDVGGVDVLTRTGLPVVNVPSSASLTAVESVFDLNPPAYESPTAGTAKFRFLRDRGVRGVALAYLAVDQSRAEANVQRRLMEAAGLKIVDVQELPLTTLNFDAAARRVANSGADYFWFIGDTSSNISMARSMAGTRHNLAFSEYFAFAYHSGYVTGAGAAGEGTITWLRALPNEEADTNDELALFLEWMARMAPGEVVDPFAVDSWASAKAFFDTLGALPGPITRDGLVAALSAVDTFDADGMYGPIRLGAKQTNGCVIGVQVRDGQWVRLAPDAGFLC